MNTHLHQRAQDYLRKLCVEIDNRRVGSQGNHEATTFFATTAASFGFTIEYSLFDCIDWCQEGVDLTIEGVAFAAFASPYSLGVKVRAPLAVVGTIEALEAAELARKIVLLHGAITAEQLMPKNFPFYNPEHHQQIIRLLEAKRPEAIITATSRDEVMVGSAYPFPLIEDGDFDIPSVYMRDIDGERLARYVGQLVSLESRARRKATTAANAIARKGDAARHRVVLFAHIDAKMGTPGATDNAAGVTTLLLLAELLADYTGTTGVEIVWNSSIQPGSLPLPLLSRK